MVLGSEAGVVGFGSCGPNRLRDLPCDAEVYTLYVAPGNQGHGFGKALMTCMCWQNWLRMDVERRLLVTAWEPGALLLSGNGRPAPG